MSSLFPSLNFSFFLELSGNVCHYLLNDLGVLVKKLARGKIIENVLVGRTHRLEELVLTVADFLDGYIMHQSVHTTIEDGDLLAYGIGLYCG